MKKLNDNKGITLIVLVITIIVLLIITGITLYTGTDSVETARENKFLTELSIVQHAAQEVYYNYTVTKNEELFVGTVAEDAEDIADDLGVTLLIDTPVSAEEKYYELSPDHLRKIGITNTEDTYIVNYKTGEVINKTQKEINSQILYIKGTTGNTITFDGTDH